MNGNSRYLVTFFFLNLVVSFKTFAQEVYYNFEKSKEIKVEGNQKQLYRVSLDKGEFLELHLLQKNVDIQILALSPENDTLKRFDSPNGKNGLEILKLPINNKGDYKFEITPIISNSLKDSIREKFINNISGSYQVTRFNVLSPKQYQKKLDFEEAQRDSAISWIKDEAITLKSVIAETGLKDLVYLKPILRDAQIVGLGEISHGTKEIFQMKHRILEFLVKKMDFKIFAIEASHIGCRPINDYVLYGKGTSREALSEQGFWIWNTEEMIVMIEWMRDYNKSVPEDKKIQFIGIDTQTVALELAYKNVSDFIKKTKINELFKIEIDPLFQELATNMDRTDMSLQRQKLYTLLSHLVVNEIRFIHETSKQEYKHIIADLRKIIQGVEAVDTKFQRSIDFNIRDENMAQTTLEILQKEPPGTKMVLWAHNFHIYKNTEAYVNGYKKPLGSVLKRYIGDKFYAIGFSTNQGTFQARNYSVKEKKTGGIASFTLPPAKEGSLDWCFAQTEKDIFFINFNISSHSNAVNTFLFNKKRRTYSVGASWTFDFSKPPRNNIEPGKYFDGMIFIKETSRAVLTPAGREEIERRLKN